MEGTTAKHDDYCHCKNCIQRHTVAARSKPAETSSGTLGSLKTAASQGLAAAGIAATI